MANQSDDNITISAIFDGSTLEAGIDSAVAAVLNGTQKMAKGFTSVSTAANQSVQGLKSVAVQATTTGQQVQQAANQASAAFGGLNNQVGNQTSATFAGLNAQVAALKVQLAALAASNPTQNLVRNFTGTQFAIHGLAQEIGVNMPRETARWVASLQGVPQLMAAAFNVIGIVGIIELLPVLADQYQKGIEALVGYGEAEKKMYDMIVSRNLELIVSNISLRESYRDIALIGTEGSTKQIVKLGNLRTEGKDLGKTMADLGKQISGMDTQVQNMTHGWQGAWEGLAGWINGDDQKIKDTKKSIEEFTGTVNQLQDAWNKNRLEQAQTLAEEKATAIEEAREISAAQIEALKTVGEARVSISINAAKRAYEASRITLAEETSQLAAEEEKRYRVIEASYAKQIKLAKSNPNAAQGTADADRLSAEAEAEALRHRDAMAAIKQTGDLEQRRYDDQAKLAQLDADKNFAEAEISVTEQAQRELAASSKLSTQQLTADLLQDQLKRAAAEKAYLEGKRAVAMEDAQKNKAQIIAIDGELATLAATNQAKLDQIRAEGDRKSLEEQKKALEEEVRAAEEAANRQLEAATKMNALYLKGHEETNRQWLQNEKAAIEQWYQASSAALHKEIAEAKQIYGENEAAYKALVDKQNQLDQERLQKLRQATQQEENVAQQAYMKMFESFNQAFLKMLNRQESFQKAFEKAWDEMVLNMIGNILKGAEQYAVSLITQEATAQKSILVSAKDSAGKAWASAPNPIVGAIEAAATFAAVMAFGSFEQGGIVPNDGFHQLHKEEMVLPKGISNSLQSAIKNGQIGGSSAGMSQSGRSGPGSDESKASHQLVYAPTVNAYDRNGMKQTLNSHKDDILSIVRGGLKAGAFS